MLNPGLGFFLKGEWKPRKCIICRKLISKPNAKNQKTCSQRCRNVLKERHKEKQARKRSDAAAFKKIRKRIASVKGSRPIRDPEYRRFIASLPCLLGNSCRCARPDDLPKFLRAVEAAHTGPHGMRQKSSDHSVIPLCRWAHQEAREAQGKDRNWFEKHGLNRETVLSNLRAIYESRRQAA